MKKLVFITLLNTILFCPISSMDIGQLVTPIVPFAEKHAKKIATIAVILASSYAIYKTMIQTKENNSTTDFSEIGTQTDKEFKEAAEDRSGLGLGLSSSSSSGSSSTDNGYELAEAQRKIRQLERTIDTDNRGRHNVNEHSIYEIIKSYVKEENEELLATKAKAEALEKENKALKDGAMVLVAVPGADTERKVAEEPRWPTVQTSGLGSGLVPRRS